MKALFIWLNRLKYDIVFLHVTYSTEEIEDIWRIQWKGKLFFSNGINPSCGVMILVRNDLQFELKSVKVDTEGRYIDFCQKSKMAAMMTAKSKPWDYI